MENTIDDYLNYLKKIKNIAYNTEVSYRQDLKKMENYFKESGITEVHKITETSLNSYILFLERKGFTNATISRNVASLKGYFDYLFKMKLIDESITEWIKSPKVERKQLATMKKSEMEKLLASFEGTTVKSIRDKAMIVLFCDTVVKVSELLNLSIYDVNFEFDYIICKGTKKDRMISFSNRTKSVLLKYFESSRDDLLNGKINKYLFVNIKGEQMSRQGFWKIIKEHSKKSGIDASVTFSMIKRS